MLHREVGWSGSTSALGEGKSGDFTRKSMGFGGRGLVSCFSKAGASGFQNVSLDNGLGKGPAVPR